MIRYLLFALTACFLFTACGGSAMTSHDSEQKFDSALRLAVEQHTAAGDSSPLDVFIRIDRDPDPEIGRRLAADGITIMASSGRILTAQGTADAMRRAARRSFVVSMELSQEQHLHN